MLNKIKIRQSEIEKFKHICRNEMDTPDDEVCYKITRNFNLGKVIKVLSRDSYVVKFGTFCMLYRDGEITLIYRDFKRPAKVSPYKKYQYDYQNRGEKYANAKCY